MPLSGSRILLAAALAASATPGPLCAALPTQDQALALAFPGAAFLRKEHFLTEPQARLAKTLAGVEFPGLWIVAYEARKDGKLLGVAFFDTHRVRTLNETAMVAIGAEGRILRVEVVAFREPQEYMAKEAWKKQLEGHGLDPDFKLNRGIRPLSGATLTANALTDASRRCLAIWRVLYGPGQ
ncbi:MAG: FMN-binding protein [Holophagaceae bacterium]|nr:FMN-binding protein [Holophagaceae bacterium]